MFITYFASWPLYFSVDTYLEGHLGEQFISNVSLVEQDLALSESSKNEVLEEEVSKSKWEKKEPSHEHDQTMNELVAKVDLNLWNGPPEKCFQKIPMIEIEDVFDHLDLTEENQNSWGFKLKKCQNCGR